MLLLFLLKKGTNEGSNGIFILTSNCSEINEQENVVTFGLRDKALTLDIKQFFLCVLVETTVRGLFP